MHFRIDHNVPELMAALTDVERKQVPQALVWSLNEMAYEVLEGAQGDMRTVFDRPTKWALEAFMVWRAKKRSLTAEVKEKPSVGARHFLKVQERGGARPQTGLERLFKTRMPYAGIIHSVLPAEAALLDAFGNWSKGERNRVLSAVRAQSDRHANSTRVSKVRNKNAKQFFVPRPGSRLSPGVWKRTSRKAKLRKVLHFSERSPKYQPRLKFGTGAMERAQKSFPDRFVRAFERAMATAW